MIPVTCIIRPNVIHVLKKSDNAYRVAYSVVVETT